MMKLEVRNDKEPPYNWNKNLLSSNTGTVYNTTEYSNYVQNRLNWVPNFISILDSTGSLLAQVILFELPPSVKGKSIPKSIPLISKKFQTIKWNFGPVFISDTHQNEIASNFLEYVQKLGKRISGTFHPFFNELLSYPNVEKWATYIIDLKKSIDDTKIKLDKKNTIKNIKRSMERGVELAEINDDNIADYAKLLNQYRIQNHIEPYSDQQVIDLWNFLKPSGFHGYLSSKDGVLLGGITFSNFNGYINEWGIARTAQDTEEKLYSQDLMKWKIIEWGIDNNQNCFDLTGFNPNPISEKEKGILRYKKKWGGTKYNILQYRG